MHALRTLDIGHNRLRALPETIGDLDGATPARVSWIVLRDAMGTVSMRLLAGVLLWFPALGLTRGLLHGLTPHDPGTLAASVGVFLVVGAAAGALPALRASRVDPIDAIRAE